MYTITKDNYHRVIVTSNYSEKQQGIIDAMLATWTELEAGAYGFTGYDYTYKVLDKLTEEQQIDVAQAIMDRRTDNSKIT